MHTRSADELRSPRGKRDSADEFLTPCGTRRGAERSAKEDIPITLRSSGLQRKAQPSRRFSPRRHYLESIYFAPGTKEDLVQMEMHYRKAAEEQRKEAQASPSMAHSTPPSTSMMRVHSPEPSASMARSLPEYAAPAEIATPSTPVPLSMLAWEEESAPVSTSEFAKQVSPPTAGVGCGAACLLNFVRWTPHAAALRSKGLYPEQVPVATPVAKVTTDSNPSISTGSGSDDCASVASEDSTTTLCPGEVNLDVTLGHDETRETVDSLDAYLVQLDSLYNDTHQKLSALTEDAVDNLNRTLPTQNDDVRTVVNNVVTEVPQDSLNQTILNQSDDVRTVVNHVLAEIPLESLNQNDNVQNRAVVSRSKGARG